MQGFRSRLLLVAGILCACQLATAAEVQSLPFISAGLGTVAAQDTAVAVDITPRRCPNPLDVPHAGPLSVAVLGTSGFDVTAVDVGTVRLAGVLPIHASFKDVATPIPLGSGWCACTADGPDGVLDLLLKFPGADIVDTLGPVNNDDVMPLFLTGTLLPEHGGMFFSGYDCVVIRVKGPRRR